MQKLLGGSYSGLCRRAARARARRPTVLVIHENRGLNAHIKDVARRLALAGFYAVAPDFLSPSGGTPANEDAARDAIGKLDLGKATAAGVAMLDALEDRRGGNGKVGAVGFCWGGAYVNRLAVAAGDKLDAGVVYYGPAPDPAEAARVKAPLMLHYAGLDERVERRPAVPWVARAPNGGQERHLFTTMTASITPSTTTPRPSATTRPPPTQAWARTLAFFRRHLA